LQSIASIPINFVALSAALSVALLWALTFRLRWLHRQAGTTAQALPFDRCFGSLGLVSYRFLFSSLHKRIGDPIVSMLTLACRALIAVVYGVFMYVAFSLLLPIIGL
jgi:hypothetical protein